MIKKEKAQKYIDDPNIAIRLAKKAADLYKRKKSQLKTVKNDLQTFIRLVQAWATRRYTHVNKSTIAWVIVALLYFVNPLDAIPDFILGLGFVDDISVIGLVMNAIHKEIEEFREWEKSSKK